MRNAVLLIGMFLIVSVFTSCRSENKVDPERLKQITEEEKEEEEVEVDSLPEVKFKRVYINSAKELSRLREQYSFADKDAPAHRAITTINRKEFRFFQVGDTIVEPDQIYGELKYYSIFPTYYKEARHIPKLVVVSAKYQCYACYEKGVIVYYAAANTGKESSQTYPGRYNINWKHKDHCSSIDDGWRMPYTVNFHLRAGNAFHQYSMQGRPRSHSCVRQFMQDAKWIFYWTDRGRLAVDSVTKCLYATRLGTMVLIIDAFDYARKRFGPWLDITDNKSVYLPMPEDPENYEWPFIPIKQLVGGAVGLPGGYDRYKYAEDTLRARGILRPEVVITSAAQTRRQKKIREQRAAADAAKRELEAGKTEENATSKATEGHNK